MRRALKRAPRARPFGEVPGPGAGARSGRKIGRRGRTGVDFQTYIGAGITSVLPRFPATPSGTGPGPGPAPYSDPSHTSWTFVCVAVIAHWQTPSFKRPIASHGSLSRRLAIVSDPSLVVHPPAFSYIDHMSTIAFRICKYHVLLRPRQVDRRQIFRFIHRLPITKEWRRLTERVYSPADV